MQGNRWSTIFILAATVMGMACGSDSPTGGKSSPQAKDGYISVRNDTDKGPVTVTFVTSDIETITTVVEVGETKIEDMRRRIAIND